jgi:hypothetical protein
MGREESVDTVRTANFCYPTRGTVNILTEITRLCNNVFGKITKKGYTFFITSVIKEILGI